MTIDFEKMKENLDTLNGYDFEEAEKAERRAGNLAVEIGTSKSFQARLAARALGVPYPEIQALNLKEYNKVTVVVFNFLYSSLDVTEISPNSTETSQ
mgnify:CR=1 FL=1